MNTTTLTADKQPQSDAYTIIKLVSLGFYITDKCN